MKQQRKIKVNLSPEDFGEDYNIHKFTTMIDPLAKALKRKYRRKFSVGTSIIFDSKMNPVFKYDRDEWNFTVSEEVYNLYKSGDKTIYYIEIEKIN